MDILAKIQKTSANHLLCLLKKMSNLDLNIKLIDWSFRPETGPWKFLYNGKSFLFLVNYYGGHCLPPVMVMDPMQYSTVRT